MPKKKKGKRGPTMGAPTTESESPSEFLPTSVPLQVRRDALQHLQDTFASQVDPDVVYFILSECDYNVEIALENLLTLAAENAPTTNSGFLDEITSGVVLKALQKMEPTHLDSFEDDESSDSFSSSCLRDKLGCNQPCSTSGLYAGPQEIYVSNEDLYTGDSSMEKFKSSDQFMFDSQPLTLIDKLPPNLEEVKEQSPIYSACSSNNDLVSTSASCDNMDSFADTLDNMKISVSSHSDSSIEADASESVVTPNHDNLVGGGIPPVECSRTHPDEFYIQVGNQSLTSFRTIDSQSRLQISPAVQSTVKTDIALDAVSDEISLLGENVDVSFLAQHITAFNSTSCKSIDKSSSDLLPTGTVRQFPPFVQSITQLSSRTDDNTDSVDVRPIGSSPNKQTETVRQFPPFIQSITQLTSRTDDISTDSVDFRPTGSSPNKQMSMLPGAGIPQFVPQWIVPTLPNQQSKRAPTPTNISVRPPFWCYTNSGARCNKGNSASFSDLNPTRIQSTNISQCSDTDIILCQKDRIIQNTNRGDKVLVILRGLPGSGKTTLAQQLRRGGIVLSTDNYFKRSGQYVYDPTALSDAHEWTRHLANVSLKEGRSPVIIDNTNTESWEMRPYVLLGLQYGYHIEIVEPETPWRFQPKILAFKNTHNVSKEKIKIMLERYEHRVSIQGILGSSNPRSLLKLKLPPSPSAVVCAKDELSPRLQCHNDLARQSLLCAKEIQVQDQNLSSMKTFVHEKSSFERVCPQHSRIEQVSEESSKGDEVEGFDLTALKKTEETHLNSVGSQDHRIGQFTEEPIKENDKPLQDETCIITENVCPLSPSKRIEHRKNNIVYPKLPDDYNVEDPHFWGADANSSVTPDEELISSSNITAVAASKRRRGRQRHEQGNVPMHQVTDKPSVEPSPEHNDQNGWYGRPSITLTDNDWKESHHNLTLESSPSTEDILEFSTQSVPKSNLECADNVPLNTQTPTSPDSSVKLSLPPTCPKHRSSRKKLAAMFSQACCADCNWEIPQFPENDNSVNSTVENLPKIGFVETSSASTETEGKYFQLAEDINIGSSEADGLLIRICRKRSICDSTHTPLPQTIIGSSRKDAGCMTDDAMFSMANSDFLRSCFPDLPEGFVEDIFNKCAGNIEWAASILVEPNNKVYTSDPFIENVRESDGGLSSELSENDVPLSHDMPRQVPQSSVESPEKFDNTRSCNDDNASQSELLASPRMIPEVKSADQEKSTQSRQSDLCLDAMDLQLTTPHEDQYFSESSNDDTEGFSENESSSSGRDVAKVAMKLDPAFARQLEQLFGPVGFSESAGGNGDDLVFEVDLNLAWQIHHCWASKLKKKTEEEDKQFEDTFCDECVAKLLQEEEHDSFTRLKTGVGNGISSSSLPISNVPVSKQQSSVPSLQEIMDLEMALQLSKDDTTKHRENVLSNGDMATRLKRQKMYEMFPKMDREALDEVFSAHNFSLTETAQALQDQNCDEELISSVILANYEQQILDAVIKESLENAKATRPTAMIRPIDFPVHDQESGFQDFRSEATIHYRMRNECFAKAQTAYTSGKKAVASFYAQQGHLHGKKMWEANQRASRRILMHQNAGREKNTIDLHLLYVQEAIGLLDEYLTNKLEELQHCSDRKATINVIVGRGRHSADKVPRLKLAVCNYLRRNNFRFLEKHAGLIQVSLT